MKITTNGLLSVVAVCLALITLRIYGVGVVTTANAQAQGAEGLPEPALTGREVVEKFSDPATVLKEFEKAFERFKDNPDKLKAHLTALITLQAGSAKVRSMEAEAKALTDGSASKEIRLYALNRGVGGDKWVPVQANSGGQLYVVSEELR